MYVTLLSHALVSRAVVRARISMIFRSQKVKRYPARRQSTYQRIVGFLLVSFILLGSLPTSVLASEVLSVVGTRGEEGEAVTTFLPAISASSGEEIQAPNEGVSVSVSGSSGEQIIGQTSPVVSGSSGTETFVPQVSLASFGEEGVVIPLPISVPVISGSSGDGSMSPPSISGSASDGFAVAPNPSGGAGDSGTLPPLISGSAGEGGAVTSVATGGADEGSSLTLDIHGSVGDGSTTSSILGSAGETIPTLSAYGDAGETLISTPVVTGSSGEIITHTLLVVSGSSGETISPTLPVVSGSSGEMVRATAPMISGSSGETTLVIVGNAGETLISTPVVTGSSGEIITHTPPVVSGSSGEVLILAPPVVSGSSGETTVPAVTGSAGETITGTPSVIGSSGETISFTPPVVLGSAGEESVLTPPVVLGNSGEIFVSNTSPLVTGSAGENIESFPPIIVVDTDVCSNIADNQATIPSGYVGNADGTCTESVVAVVDVCSNIAGAQATVPSGYTASGGVCTQQNTGGGGGGGGTVTVSTGGGGGGGGGGGSYVLSIINSSVRQTCDSLTFEWYTNQPAKGRALVGLSAVDAIASSTSLLGYSVEFVSDTMGTTHTFNIPSVRGVTYFLRPVSVIPGYKEVVGPELRVTGGSDPSCGGVTTTGGGTSTVDTCPYITDYLQQGKENSIEQVTRLQLFLTYKEGINVPMSGVFDSATEQGVRTFQERYRGDILDPWGSDIPASGYVYILTTWKINQLVCGGGEIQPPVTSVRENISTPIPPDVLIGFEWPVSTDIAVVATSTIKVPIVASTIGTGMWNLAAIPPAIAGVACSIFSWQGLTNILLLIIALLLLLLLIQREYIYSRRLPIKVPQT